jgi:DnaK suppressor protein
MQEYDGLALALLIHGHADSVGFNKVRFRKHSRYSHRMREKLLKLRKDIESIAAIGDESESIVELDQAKVGRLSRMDALQGQAMAKASGQRREIMLRNIDAALKRIDNGDYGICRDCDEAINPKRLEFDPTALRCIECQSKRDEEQ